MLIWLINRIDRLISEGSCDTEDWSNHAENSSVITRINIYILNFRKEFNITALLYF